MRSRSARCSSRWRGRGAPCRRQPEQYHTAIASNLLSQAVGRLIAIVESYPQLSASTKFCTLREDLRDIEDKIAFARAFYNRLVLDYNTRIENYPVAALAVHFGFARAELFEAGHESHAGAELIQA